MRKYYACLALIGLVAAWAYPADSVTVSTKSEHVMKTLERILAKTGISFDGEFRSQFLSAGAGGAAVDNKKLSTSRQGRIPSRRDV
jgi:ribonuclease HI